MSVVGRTLMVFLVILPLIAATVTMTVWWLPALCIAGGGLAFLGLGARAGDELWDRGVWAAVDE